MAESMKQAEMGRGRRNAVHRELESRGEGAREGTLMAALAAAGLRVVDAGGAVVDVVETITPVRRVIAGSPGLILCSAEVAPGDTRHWFERRTKEGGMEIVPL